ncbi:hypothetical protein EJ06DRAFT_470931 [Trichodelitschia bisporula]|uniref:Uncharacterized protein n=1 Tax=Trichodelitschia bisporula TaxID=703511 RepID=A0A6G1I6N7_9PEZI|nr:hypothetical protein EJ06DRAFT_470931 [Trichodelitschia bisporula]
MSDAPIHSTGRGGEGNIGPDPNVYADGGIIREGFQGVSPEGEYSSGRGGAGNIVASPKLGPTEGRRSTDVIPETALRTDEGHENFHTGRGGGGNVHKEKYGGHTTDPSKPSIVDKAKSLFHKDKSATKPEGSS